MNIPNSARLSFRLMSADDAELFFRLDQDPEVMKYINGGKVVTMQEILNVSIPRLLSYTNLEKGWGMWGVNLIESNAFIGWVLVRPMNFFSDSPQLKNLELGWRFMRETWGKGIATEAAMQVKNALIKSGTVEAFSAIALEDNHASIHIMKKLGMTYRKTDIHRDPLGDSEVVFYQLDV